ncbi:ImmA/IrrE family metallo-endopeptidase [Tsukamurella soli]
MPARSASPRSAARDLRTAEWNVDGRIPFPVDPFEIAARLGVEVHVAPLASGVAGFAVKDDGPAEIYVDSRSAAEVQRCVVAHELGRIVENRGADRIGHVYRRDGRSSAAAESWADRFAAELLMPEAIVVKNWAEGWSPERLRRRFDVSGPAMTHRLSGLGLI